MADPHSWSAVDALFVASLVESEAALQGALEASDAAGLPAISVTPNQGKLLQLLARSIHARSILEIGTLGGYSTIWLARALEPGGRLITLELEEAHARVARGNLAAAGLTELVEVRVGPAVDSLRALEKEGGHCFDFVFIDADKESNLAYLQSALRLCRRGTLIVVDNVARAGAVADADSPDPAVQGVRHLLNYLSREPRVSATAVQTVGSKGHDGFLLALVL